MREFIHWLWTNANYFKVDSSVLINNSEDAIFERRNSIKLLFFAVVSTTLYLHTTMVPQRTAAFQFWVIMNSTNRPSGPIWMMSMICLRIHRHRSHPICGYVVHRSIWRFVQSVHCLHAHVSDQQVSMNWACHNRILSKIFSVTWNVSTHFWPTLI